MNISIIGGGIGGLATAIALRQRGFQVAVYERDPQATDIGAGIVCWPNASFVLHELGILDEVRAVSGQPVSMRRISRSGEALGELDLQALNRKMSFPSYSILRRDLMRVLLARLSDLGVEVYYGHRLRHIESSGDSPAVAVFDDGKSIQPDVLIGADGRMNSVSRKFIQQDNRPVYQGFINWIGVFETDQPLFEEIAVCDYWGVGERFGVVPVTHGKAYWAGGIAAPEIGTRNPEDFRKELQTVFSDWPHPIPNIIDQSRIERVNKIYVHDHDPVDTWHRGNVLMIGDAAHAPLPTSGQGACQALEDAWHLSKLFEKGLSDIERLFATFTAQRKGKTAGITLAARQFASSLFNTDEAYCRQRNDNSKATDFLSAVHGMAKGWSSGLPIGGS